jgi:hypothetical protein
VTRREEVETLFGDEGAIKVLEQAKKAGKVRFLGLKLAPKFTPLTPEEAEAMKQKGQATELLFRFPANA